VKLINVQITNFRSIQDSSEFDIADVTCLVGKNESGKTAILQALHKLNPIESSASNKDFNVDREFPRRNLVEYRKKVRNDDTQHYNVVKATFLLNSFEISVICDKFGQDCFLEDAPTLTLSKGYSNELIPKLNLHNESIINHMIESSNLPVKVYDAINDLDSISDILELLSSLESHTQASTNLGHNLAFFAPNSLADFSIVVYNHIKNHVPKFLYFDDYYQMTGLENLEAIQYRLKNNSLQDSDWPFIGLVKLAGLDLEDLSVNNQTTTRIAILEAAGNAVTNQILPYWSQNQNLKMKFEVHQASPVDPPEMQTGTNVWGFIEDTIHQASTEVSVRSKGFVWFFSFVTWYSSLREENDNLILLLDEPGLSLHGKAQDDLLRYIEEQLKPHHQVIYTTHSPFMVDSNHLDRVRIVQDKSIDPGPNDQPNNRTGVKVTTDVLEVTSDSLFPLQGAMGYEINQSLFVGPNCLVVEGVSDFLYIQAMSDVLQDDCKPGLDSRWTITPVGGASNVPTFVALIGAQTNLNIAMLLDSLMSNQQRIDNLIYKKLVKSKQVLTYDNFIASSSYADVEDMFNPRFYINLVNKEYKSSLKLSDLPKSPPRITERIESHLKHHPLPHNARFNHYRPARLFNTNIQSLRNQITKKVLDRWQSAFNELNALLPD
jgi:predicted ATPase